MHALVYVNRPKVKRLEVHRIDLREHGIYIITVVFLLFIVIDNSIYVFLWTTLGHLGWLVFHRGRHLYFGGGGRTLAFFILVG